MDGVSDVSNPSLLQYALAHKSWHAVIELVKPPDLNQARVNKCLIALVNRKIVRKENSTVGHNHSNNTHSPDFRAGHSALSLDRIIMRSGVVMHEHPWFSRPIGFPFFLQSPCTTCSTPSL